MQQQKIFFLSLNTAQCGFFVFFLPIFCHYFQLQLKYSTILLLCVENRSKLLFDLSACSKKITFEFLLYNLSLRRWKKIKLVYWCAILLYTYQVKIGVGTIGNLIHWEIWTKFNIEYYSVLLYVSVELPEKPMLSQFPIFLLSYELSLIHISEHKRRYAI